MVKGTNNYFNAVPTSDTLDSNADIPIAETVAAHPLGGDHYTSSSAADGGGRNAADPSFTIDDEDGAMTGAAATNGNGNVIMVEINAPANLHEGYKFDAFFNGVSFPVIVPAGGCRKGQILVVPFNPNASNGTPNAWKDGILACTRYGIFHPSFLCAWCCPLILLGQIMTRLKMDWAGHVSPRPDEWKKTFRTLLLLGLFKYALIDDENQDYLPAFSHVLHSTLLLLYALYLIFLLIRVRRHVRDRDGIPEERLCGKFEDCCMACFCSCCTVSQLARQTANYDVEIGYFLTQDGLAPPSDDCYDHGNGQQGDSLVV